MMDFQHLQLAQGLWMWRSLHLTHGYAVAQCVQELRLEKYKNYMVFKKGRHWMKCKERKKKDTLKELSGKSLEFRDCSPAHSLEPTAMKTVFLHVLVSFFSWCRKYIKTNKCLTPSSQWMQKQRGVECAQRPLSPAIHTRHACFCDGQQVLLIGLFSFGHHE